MIQTRKRLATYLHKMAHSHYKRDTTAMLYWMGKQVNTYGPITDDDLEMIEDLIVVCIKHEGDYDECHKEFYQMLPTR